MQHIKTNESIIDKAKITVDSNKKKLPNLKKEIVSIQEYIKKTEGSSFKKDLNKNQLNSLNEIISENIKIESSYKNKKLTERVSLRHLLSESLNSLLQISKFIETTNYKINQCENQVISLREHLKKLTEWESELEDVETDSNNKMQMIEMVEDDQEREYLKNVMEKEKKG